MTDKKINEDVAIPDSDIMDDAPVERARRDMSPVLKVSLIALAAATVIGGSLFMASPTVQQESKTRRPPNIDATPGGDNQRTSELYQNSIETLNKRRAEEAAELGLTSVPTPEAVMTKLDPVPSINEVAIKPEASTGSSEAPVTREAPTTSRRILPQPKPAPQTVNTYKPQQQRQVETTAAQGAAEKKENPYLARISGVMRGTATMMGPGQMTTEDMSTTNRDEENVANAGNGQANGAPWNPGSGSGDEADYSPENTLMRPGDVIYAETLTSVNSDMDTPVLAEVVSGKHKGARLVGEFIADKSSDRMIVNFTSMTFADGRIHAISAVAVDGKSAETAVASDVERRFISRYGPILAATFIGGYAQAYSRPAQTVIGTGDNAQVITEQSPKKEALLSGVAAGAQAVAQDITRYAPKGPKIILRDGWPLGVLFLEPVRIDGPARHEATSPVVGIPRPGMPSNLPEGAMMAPVLKN